MFYKTLPILLSLTFAFILSFVLGSSLAAILVLWAALAVLIRITGIFNPKDPDPEREDEILFLKNLFIISLVVRLSLALLLYYYDSKIFNPYFFAPDSSYYAFKGWAIAQLWMGKLSEFSYQSSIPSWGKNAYFYFHAICYYIAGEKIEFLPASFNCFIGAVLPIISYFLAKEFGVTRKCAKWVGIFISLWPSLILWSAIGIRDSWSILVFNILLLCYLRFTREKHILYLSIISLCLFLIFTIRPYLLPLTLIALFSSFYISKSKNIPVLFFLSIVAIFLANHLDAFFNISRYLDPDTIQMYRESFGGSRGAGFMTNVELSSPIGYFKMITVSLIYYFFAPFPWQLFGSKLRAFSFPETFLIYISFYYLIRGILIQLKVNKQQVIPLLLLFFVISVSYSIIEANYGTLFRHRAQVLTLLLIFVPIGFYYRRVSLNKFHSH